MKWVAEMAWVKYTSFGGLSWVQTQESTSWDSQHGACCQRQSRDSMLCKAEQGMV